MSSRRARERCIRRFWPWGAVGRAAAALFLHPAAQRAIVRGQVDPTLSLGLPPGRPFWDNFHPATAVEFLRYMAGGEGSNVGTGFTRMFDWANYAEVGSRFSQSALHEMGLLALFFAAIGVALAFKRDAWLTLAVVIACAICVPYGLLYPEADQDRYLMTAFWGIALFAAVGAGRGIRAYADESPALAHVAGPVVLCAAASA